MSTAAQPKQAAAAPRILLGSRSGLRRTVAAAEQSSGDDFQSALYRSYDALHAASAGFLAAQAKANSVIDTNKGALAGEFIVADSLTGPAATLPLAALLTGACFLGVDSDPEAAKNLLRHGQCDFVVNSLDEALRILKNELRQKAAVAVCLTADVAATFAEMVERGLAPDLLLQAQSSAPGTLRESEQQLAATGTVIEPVHARGERRRIDAMVAAIRQRRDVVTDRRPRPRAHPGWRQKAPPLARGIALHPAANSAVTGLRRDGQWSWRDLSTPSPAASCQAKSPARSWSQRPREASLSAAKRTASYSWLDAARIVAHTSFSPVFLFAEQGRIVSTFKSCSSVRQRFAQGIPAVPVRLGGDNNEWPLPPMQRFKHLRIRFLRRNIAVHQADTQRQALALFQIRLDKRRPLRRD